MSMAPSASAQRAWIALFRAQKGALERIEAALKAADLPPLAWYDVLWELERAAPGGLRPFELEARLLLPQYGLSRLLARIAAAGLLDRRPCPEDRRGHLLRANRRGRAMRRRIWAVYGPVMAGIIDARLAPAEADRLCDLLDALRGGV